MNNNVDNINSNNVDNSNKNDVNNVRDVYMNNLDSKNLVDVNNISGNGFKVKIFDLKMGLTEYENVKIVRIISKDYNLLIMEDYLPIIGEIDGSIDIKGENVDVSYSRIEAFYMNSGNVFNLMVKEAD